MKERGKFLMNNKAEYNRCALPRLTAKLEKKDLEKWRDGDKKYMDKEASIKEKIRIINFSIDHVSKSTDQHFLKSFFQGSD